MILLIFIMSEEGFIALFFWMKLHSFYILVSLVRSHPIFSSSHRDSRAFSIVQFTAALHFLGSRGALTARGEV